MIRLVTRDGSQCTVVQASGFCRLLPQASISSPPPLYLMLPIWHGKMSLSTTYKHVSLRSITRYGRSRGPTRPSDYVDIRYETAHTRHSIYSATDYLVNRACAVGHEAERGKLKGIEPVLQPCTHSSKVPKYLP